MFKLVIISLERLIVEKYVRRRGEKSDINFVISREHFGKHSTPCG
jgi:hypothetical protein